MPVPPVPLDALRWRCPPSDLDFQTTADLAPASGIVGQEAAADALRFGLQIHAPGHNVFVRGHVGTGRRTLVMDQLRELAPSSPPPRDRAFVFHFAEPNQPRLLTLPPGQAPRLRQAADDFVQFLLEDLADHINHDSIRAQIRELEQRAGERISQVSGPFEAALSASGLALVGTGGGEGSRPAIVPVVDGQPVPFEEAGDAEQVARLRQRASDMMTVFQDVSAQVVKIRKESQHTIRELVHEHTKRVLAERLSPLRDDFPDAVAWLDEVQEDVLARLAELPKVPQLVERYRVLVLRSCPPGAPRPVVVENAPTVQRLLGGIDLANEGPRALAPHLGIHAGALVHASGGTLVLDAQELLSEPGAWPNLKRALLAGSIELTPIEAGASTLRAQHLRPQSIPVEVKVVLIGQPGLWAALDQNDPDFSRLFKVLVDLDDVVERNSEGVGLYAQVVARIAAKEELLPFSSGAVGALVEHGARIAAQRNRLTARFGRIADLAREGAFLARGRGDEAVRAGDIEQAILDGKRRADLPGRRFRQRITSGLVQIATSGQTVGEVNGLAVIRAGPLTYGFPMRITASVGAGREGAIHLQREAMLSGQIHTKGFLTVRGLLRFFLAVPHPIVFDASITHEQSYGGVDGDSASAAEFVCLMSAITGLPVRQGLAMTGAVDQHGNVLPVGAVDEKIEGFFDTCAVRGLTGDQGVLIPAVGVPDLQLRPDVVQATANQRFAVFPIARIEEALELMLGESSDEIRARAVDKVVALWQAVQKAP